MKCSKWENYSHRNGKYPSKQVGQVAGASLEKEKDSFMKEARQSKFTRQPSKEGALHNHETIRALHVSQTPCLMA